MQTIAFHKKCARSDRDWYVSHQPVLVHLLINILIIIMYVNRNVSIAFLSMKFILTSATGFRFTSREILCSTNTEHMQLDIKHSSMYQQNEQLFNKLQNYKYVWKRWENLTIIIIWKQNIFIESCCVLYEQIIILKSLDLICAMRVTFVQHHYTRLFYNPLAIVVIHVNCFTINWIIGRLTNEKVDWVLLIPARARWVPFFCCTHCLLWLVPFSNASDFISLNWQLKRKSKMSSGDMISYFYREICVIMVMVVGGCDAHKA